MVSFESDAAWQTLLPTMKPLVVLFVACLGVAQSDMYSTFPRIPEVFPSLYRNTRVLKVGPIKHVLIGYISKVSTDAFCCRMGKLQWTRVS